LLAEIYTMVQLSFFFNIILIALFVKLISKAESEYFFNPFVGYVTTRINKLLDFLKPVLALPEQMALLIIVISLFFFKTLLISRLSPTISLSFGQLITCTPASEIPEQISLLTFSLLNTISFLFKFWGFYFLASLIAAPNRKNRASDAFKYYAKPFSSIPFIYQPIILLALHAALAGIASNLGSLSFQPQESSSPVVISLTSYPIIVQIIKTVWLGLLSLSDAIMVMIQVLFISIIGSMISTILKKRDMMILCNEASELVLGRFARRASANSGMDFTPIIFFFAAHYGYMILSTFVTNLINTPIQLPF
jgi:hypothetical protein